jgi:hypothetical protein
VTTGDGDGEVLPSARVNVYDEHTSIGATALSRRLVDAGDHVIWHDGGTATTWTLPDQPPRDGTPVLTSVARVDTAWSSAEGPSPETYLLLLDQNGRTLARLALVSLQMGPTYEPVDAERIWPDEVFEPLAARGVPVVTEEFAAFEDLERAHPGAVPTSRLVLGSRWANRVFWAFLVASLVAAVLIAWASR